MTSRNGHLATVVNGNFLLHHWCLERLERGFCLPFFACVICITLCMYPILISLFVYVFICMCYICYVSVVTLYVAFFLFNVFDLAFHWLSTVTCFANEKKNISKLKQSVQWFSFQACFFTCGTLLVFFIFACSLCFSVSHCIFFCLLKSMLTSFLSLSPSLFVCKFSPELDDLVSLDLQWCN